MAKAAINLTGFVNIHGQPLVADGGPSFKRRAPPKAAPRAVQPDASPSGKHMGWAATGFSPDQLRAARIEHERLGKDFNEEAYMNGAQPKKARPQPYSVPSAAQQCADMLLKAGWKRVRVVEVVRP